MEFEGEMSVVDHRRIRLVTLRSSYPLGDIDGLAGSVNRTRVRFRAAGGGLGKAVDLGFEAGSEGEAKGAFVLARNVCLTCGGCW